MIRQGTEYVYFVASELIFERCDELILAFRHRTRHWFFISQSEMKLRMNLFAA